MPFFDRCASSYFTCVCSSVMVDFASRCCSVLQLRTTPQCAQHVTAARCRWAPHWRHRRLTGRSWCQRRRVVTSSELAFPHTHTRWMSWWGPAEDTYRINAVMYYILTAHSIFICLKDGYSGKLFKLFWDPTLSKCLYFHKLLLCPSWLI